ncbi:MAG TPA: lipid-A-disaccharide synthase [Kamptonema sp.]|nr:lipid-A-disaccharide synthase [Kamptonema sp.]
MSVDILILSNGPGEITTWVRPVVQALRQQLGCDRTLVRISVVLSPCPNATGKEAAIALSYPEVDRVQAAEDFSPFLLRGKTAENWDWREKGVVLFLGGDQFFTVIIGKHLSYRTVVYAEWEARWYRWIDRFGVMKPEMIANIPKKYVDKFSIVGDLMADVTTGNSQNVTDKLSVTTTTTTNNSSVKSVANELIGFLPGSKPAKLASGLPLSLAIAEQIHRLRPQTRFVIPVAPTLDLQTLAGFANPQQNPIISLFGGISAQLHLTDSPFLQTKNGVRVELYEQFPAYNLLSQCHLCLTTIGANTAELGALAVPMIVLLPTQQMDAMKAWDGLPGILANLPLLGSAFATAINWLVLQLGKGKLYAWPNIWAKAEIVPELVGKLEPETLAKLVIDYLSHPKKLEEMRDRLRAVRGESGAAKKLAQLVCEELLLLSNGTNGGDNQVKAPATD